VGWLLWVGRAVVLIDAAQLEGSSFIADHVAAGDCEMVSICLVFTLVSDCEGWKEMKHTIPMRRINNAARKRPEAIGYSDEQV